MYCLKYNVYSSKHIVKIIIQSKKQEDIPHDKMVIEKDNFDIKLADIKLLKQIL